MTESNPYSSSPPSLSFVHSSSLNPIDTSSQDSSLYPAQPPIVFQPSDYPQTITTDVVQIVPLMEKIENNIDQTSNVEVEKEREVIRTHSLNDFSQDSSEDSISKNEKRRLSRISYRNRIANEIIETERNYIKNLKVLIGLYVNPLRSTVNTPDEIVSEEDVKNIFSNVELLVKINSELLTQLEQRMENWSDTQLIGDVFDKMAPHFKLYTDYGKNYLTALNTVDALSQTNQKFAEFLKLSQRLEDNHNLTMHAFLIAPIQRLPRIILLLSDLKSHTEPDHPDYVNLDSALQKFQHVTDHVNEGIKYAENTRKIVELQNRFAGNMNFLHPTRKFIREGRLQKITSRLERSCMFFLFNDQLVYAYEIMGYYHYKGLIPLHTSWINDLPDTSDKQNLFQVVGEKKTYTLYAPTPQIKQDWINDLNAQINKLVELNPYLLEKRSAVKVRSRGGLWKPLGELLGQSLPYMSLKDTVTSPPSSTSLPVIPEASPLVNSRSSLKLIQEANQAPPASGPSQPPDHWTCCSQCNIL